MKITNNDDSIILGRKKDIKALEQKDHARLLVVSDSHGNSQIFSDIVRRYGKDCDALIFCGDGLTDLSSVLGEAEKDRELAQALPKVTAFVRGNCDIAGYGAGEGRAGGGIFGSWGNGGAPLQKTSGAPVEQFLTVNGHKIMIVHGHAHGADYGTERLGLTVKLSECDCIFYGHTHIASFVQEGGFYFVNPGSCARPRGGQPASFAIATVEKTFIDVAFIKTADFSLWQPLC